MAQFGNSEAALDWTSKVDAAEDDDLTYDFGDGIEGEINW